MNDVSIVNVVNIPPVLKARAMQISPPFVGRGRGMGKPGLRKIAARSANE